MLDRVPTIELPEPCLVVLVGPAGSGKTTFAARHFRPDEIVSSDALREAMTGDAADQSMNRAVFVALHHEVERRLAAGRTTVVDATNVERHARRALVRIAARTVRPAVAVVLGLPLTETLTRNVRRPGRAVPADVVERHHALVVKARERRVFEHEGFLAVHELSTAGEVEAVEIRRVLSGS